MRRTRRRSVAASFVVAIIAVKPRVPRSSRNNLEVCPGCGFHYRLSAEGWIELLLDPGSWEEHDRELEAVDPLGFVDSKAYTDRIAASQKKSGVRDAFMSGAGAIAGRPVQLGLFVFRFMGGSMGSVVGERIARLFERGTELRQPVILLSASGGARMQEGALSLMQMAKTVAALGRLSRCSGSLHQRAAQPHDRWGCRELRIARRCQYRRAQGPDWFRRTARDRADDPSTTPRGISASGVSA